MTRFARKVSLLQGAYYIVTGLWPLINMESFDAVTGPKAEDWLVRTFGVMVAAVGVPLVAMALQGTLDRSARALALTFAVALAVTEAFFSLRGTIWPIYLADSIVELAFGLAQAATLIGSERRASFP